MNKRVGKFGTHWRLEKHQFWPYVDINLSLLGVCLFGILHDGNNIEIELFGFYFYSYIEEK